MSVGSLAGTKVLALRVGHISILGSPSADSTAAEMRLQMMREGAAIALDTALARSSSWTSALPTIKSAIESTKRMPNANRSIRALSGKARRESERRWTFTRRLRHLHDAIGPNPPTTTPSARTARCRAVVQDRESVVVEAAP